jgi:hypothetical protein
MKLMHRWQPEYYFNFSSRMQKIDNSPLRFLNDYADDFDKDYSQDIKEK